MNTEKMIDMIYKHTGTKSVVKKEKSTILNLLEECAEEIENLYGRETDLTIRIREILEKDNF